MPLTTVTLTTLDVLESPALSVATAVSMAAVGVPAMGIWSSGDPYLTEEGLLGSGDHVTGPWRYERIEGAGHWLQLDAPNRVNKLLLDFLS